MCAQPLGNALYGVLFEICKGFALPFFLRGRYVPDDCTSHVFPYAG